MTDASRIVVEGLDHVQLAMPRGEEVLARMFYAGLLGLREVRKPRALARRGGAWFIGPGVSIHLGVEDPFRPATKAHAAVVVRDLDVAFDVMKAHGMTVDWSAGATPARRFYVDDPFGNRIEILDARDAGFTARQRPR